MFHLRDFFGFCQNNLKLNILQTLKYRFFLFTWRSSVETCLFKAFAVHLESLNSFRKHEASDKTSRYHFLWFISAVTSTTHSSVRKSRVT